MKQNPIHKDRSSATGRAVLDRRVAHIPDTLADADYRWGVSIRSEKEMHRTILAVPMLKGDTIIGVIAIRRTQVQPFTDKQIAVLSNFADQAVIAIENARLVSELHESLQQQMATSEILSVISSSGGELEQVFQSILENATRLCEAKFGHFYRWGGGAFRLVAKRNTPPVLAEERLRSPLRPTSNEPLGRMVATKRVVHVADATTEPAYLEKRDSALVTAVDLGGVRTVLAVSMLNEGELIGALTIYRQDVHPFTDKQIELVTDFANQAVIAIENARLFNELRQRTADLTERTADLTEALDQQTATSTVLDVISRSAFDLKAVFEAVAESSVRLCGADRAFIYRFDGDMLRMAVAFNTPPEFKKYVEQNPIRPGRHTCAARTALERQTIHIPDIFADQFKSLRKNPHSPRGADP